MQLFITLNYDVIFFADPPPTSCMILQIDLQLQHQRGTNKHGSALKKTVTAVASLQLYWIETTLDSTIRLFTSSSLLHDL